MDHTALLDLHEVKPDTASSMESEAVSEPQIALQYWRQGLGLHKQGEQRQAIAQFAMAGEHAARSHGRQGSADTLTRALIKESITSLGMHFQAQGKTLIAPSGKHQKWLIDLRSVFMHAPTLELIVRAFWDRFQHAPAFQVAGMETAAIPLLTGILLGAPKDRHVNGIIIRKDRKSYGLGNALEGQATGEPVILIDDVMNSGKSAEKARVVLEQAGMQIADMFVVVDYRSQAGIQWRHDRQIKTHTLFNLVDFGLSLTSDPLPLQQQYRECWKTAVAGGYPYHVVPKSAPLLVSDTIYRGCDAGKMHAFDAQTGAVKWAYEALQGTSRKGIWSCPIVHEGRLYFGAYNGAVYCLDAETGSEIWVSTLGDWVGASPLVVPQHNLLFIGIESERPWAQGSLVALDLSDGKKVWELFVKKYQHGSAAYWQGGDLVMWGSADHETLAIEPRCGKVAWSFPTVRSVKGAPAIDEQRGLVAFASFDKHIYVVDAATGQPRLQYETGDLCYTTPLFVNGRLFCGSGDRHLYVFDMNDMTLLKKIDLGSRVYAAPVLVQDRIMVGTTGGKVYEFDSDTLAKRGCLQVPDAVTNAIAASPDGRHVYVSTYMNHLYAFERLQAQPKPLRHFTKMAVDIPLEAMVQELENNAAAWQVNTRRQSTIACQRETESIFLRSARKLAEGERIDDVQESQETDLAATFPSIMAFLKFATHKLNGELGRALLAKLKPEGQVYRHVDGGAYYATRNRYHLVLQSPEGSPMIAGDEEVRMMPGELWQFDNKQPHEAFNRSCEDRIHLIFDLKIAS
ncbi:MAG: PQQ-binding-like beta-propeller repeat protein [Aquabacterium sp.]